MHVLKSKLSIGLTRSEVYARIKASHRVAFNPSYDRWYRQPDGTYVDEAYRKEPNGVLTLVPEVQQWPTPITEPPGHRVPRELWYPDAWPNEEHPWVEVAYDMGSKQWFCTDTMYLRLDFDKNERLSGISEKPAHDCSPP
jgi:hypothetical protein